MTADRHLRLSLATTAIFLAMGLWLETMLGLRAQGVVDDALRREFLRLGHAHGALLGLLNVVLGLAMARLHTPVAWATRIRLAAFLGALAVGFGFVGGGLWHGPTDPGPLVLLLSSLGATVLLRSDRAPADAEPPA
jgi:hypothetical protein